MAWGCIGLVELSILGSPLLLLNFILHPSTANGLTWGAATLLGFVFLLLPRRYKRAIELRDRGAWRIPNPCFDIDAVLNRRTPCTTSS